GPPFDRDRCPHVLARVGPLLLGVYQVEVVAWVAFVQRRGGELVAAVVTQNALLRARRQRRIREGDGEPAGPVARVGAGGVVRREGNERSHEGRRGHDVERGVGDRGETAH